MNTRIGLVAALLCAGACSGDAGPPQASGSSHWLPCRSLTDCADAPDAVACREQRCVDAAGTPIAPPEPSSAAPDGGAGTAGTGGTMSGGGASAGASAGTGGGTSASAGAAASAPDAGDEACLRSDYARPELDKSCMTAADCFVAFHMADCCRSQLALAFNLTERAAFDMYESSCGLPCTCPAMQPQAEDGSTLLTSETPIAECVAGGCLSRGSDPDDCSGTMECTDLENGGMCVAATGPVGNTFCRGADGVCNRCRCAAPDTPIATPDGERPIASLREGDLVYSIDGPGIRIVPIARVSRTAAVHHQVMRVTLASGRTLEISPGHPTADGRSFAQLNSADELGGVPVVEARLIDYEHAFTHDILPASSTGTYFAAGVPIGSTLF